jgi:AbiV family abortive infection protein
MHVSKTLRSFLEEAQILLSNGRAPRAYMLAFTALEELGKSELVADYFNDAVAESEFKEAFRDHKLKLRYLQRAVNVPAKTGGLTISQ